MTRALALLAVLVATARAEPTLRLAHEPPPRHLRMRARAAAVTPAPAPSQAPAPIPHAPDAGPDATLVRDVDASVSVRVNLGYVVDGTALTDQRSLNNKFVSTRLADFSQIHAYGFGEGYLSTHGVGLESLSSYFAGRFQLTRQDSEVDPNNIAAGPQVRPPPIATWFDRSGVSPRAGWLEVKDFLPSHTFKPLRVRAGELYVYGPWVLHMYGLIAAWDGKLVKGTVYTGSRVPDYTLAENITKDRTLIGGSSLRVDLRDLKDPIPFSVAGEALAFTAAGASKASNHTQLELDWRPGRDLALIGQARSIDNALANEHVQFRSRYKQVTNLVFDLTHRHATDWRWDPSVVGPDTTSDPMAPRRYLDLGPVLPQLLLSARGGTLIAENIDVYVRTALASDLTTDATQKSTYSASYVELGGAVEVRMRRTIALGASGLTRQTQRIDPISRQIQDNVGVIDPLPGNASPSLGERGFTEFGGSLRMTLGARKFSALVELYGRRTRYALDYCAAASCAMSTVGTGDTGIATSDVRGGGRFTVDAWIGRQLRLFASYEVSTKLDFAPEITGYKSLRMMIEGIY